ncbi:MAG: hypothetical protein CSA32_04720 [Desulfobulbus propionicus]|nr:MAG: hypothetical protein CSA32_04720 [Desulfobulbus propionicus]
MSAAEVMKFCGAKAVLNKEYKNWVMAQTRKIVDRAKDYPEKHIASPGIHLTSWVWSCLGTGWSYRAHFCGRTGCPVVRSYQAH